MMILTVIGKETSYSLKRGAGKPAIDAWALRSFETVSFLASSSLV
jgi:hypothetical protein